VRLDEVVAALDAYFGVPDVRGDDWSGTYELLYPDPYWREFAEPGYEGRWNGLVVRGDAAVGRAVTCVFPSDAIVASLEPRTFLFSEHPIAFEDDVEGFEPLARASYERLREQGSSFYHVHAPLDQHPVVSPSRLAAEGVGLAGLEEYFPIAEGIPGGAAIIGETDLTLDGRAVALRSVLGPEIPVHVLSRPRERAGRVAVVAGGGAEREIL
jgi:putative NIF3 family GTP cyclohydrolase 1 type 2